jgi:hypothetical protein
LNEINKIIGGERVWDKEINSPDDTWYFLSPSIDDRFADWKSMYKGVPFVEKEMPKEWLSVEV